MGRLYTSGNQLVIPHGVMREDGMPTAFIGIGGRYKLHVEKAKSGTITHHDLAWRKNLVTNNGLDLIYNMTPSLFTPQQYYCCNCAVGTGNTVPAVTDTQLVSYVANAAPYNNQFSQSYTAAAGSVPPYWTNQVVCQFGTGAAAGNLAELGMFPSLGSYQSLVTRALIVDSNGNPTTITVLSNEILTVTYQMLYYLNPNDTSFTFNVNGVPVTGVYRLMNMTNPNQGIGQCMQATNNIGQYPVSNALITIFPTAIQPNTSAPSSSLSTSINCYKDNTTQAYTNDIANSGTCYVDIQGITFDVNHGNYGGGITAFTVQARMFQYQFGNLSAAIMKTNTESLSMGFRMAWGRYS